MSDPAEIIAALVRAGATVATAESLTGGLVSAALTSVPGASAAVRGGVVAYATDLKHELAGVPADTLRRDGPVAARTASAMATGVRRKCAATYGVATTGVAGPDAQDGHPPGTVHVAVAGPEGVRIESVTGLPGDRAAVRQAAVRHALDLLAQEIIGPRESPSESRR
ncbi:MAG TPA: nicotinamide-nucleotide amidohydrolase family protein [Jiangellales bacterium]|nr:nicotinamide-nucleotide amidohydrolase family protein [Jiangellales bacterium]